MTGFLFVVHPDLPANPAHIRHCQPPPPMLQASSTLSPFFRLGIGGSSQVIKHEGMRGYATEWLDTLVGAGSFPGLEGHPNSEKSLNTCISSGGVTISRRLPIQTSCLPRIHAIYNFLGLVGVSLEEIERLVTSITAR